MSKDITIAAVLGVCTVLIATAYYAHKYHKQALIDEDDEDDIDWGAETVIINNCENLSPESEKIFTKMVGRGQRTVEKKGEVIIINEEAANPIREGFKSIVEEKMEITMKPTYEELQQRLDVTLNALERIRGIEMWIKYGPMRVLFQQTVYPAIAKGRGEDK
jgi:hypothetical protein